MSDLLRVYLDPDEIGADGYPYHWHKPHEYHTRGGVLVRHEAIKDRVRGMAGHRCVRCGHPYQKGAHGKGEWSPCDDLCRHGGPVRWSNGSEWETYDGTDETIAQYVQAQWRILTVHHLNGVKHDCRWWNLAALCQRCHLTIQGRVVIERVYQLEHSDWFKPYAAGWYAWAYLGEDLTRDEVEARLDELLALELAPPSATKGAA